MRFRVFIIVILTGGFFTYSCREKQAPSGTTTPEVMAEEVSGDAALFRAISQTQPYRSYALFPHADSVTAGSLNGSTAHRPLVRVSMNPVALDALQGGRYAAPFPDRSIIVKEIKDDNGATTLLAVMYKDRNNPLAGNGWLWAEFYPNGATFISMTQRGAGCTGCHALEMGPQHDYVRTFERQR
ncbi:MAG: cytochrome P460 family protein [Bacteroidetes bacterium]|nr:cytochrome P460 family protein [Bacteroidota bacterium]MCW5895784.1 cytochrome P460 family protein [Bacteroidota bacterium]